MHIIPDPQQRKRAEERAEEKSPEAEENLTVEKKERMTGKQ